jgi:uncharacterized membrane protein YbhN (UPF0104 family)
MFIVIASFTGIFFTFLITGFKLAHKLPQKMPMRDTMIDISAAYHAYAHAWGTSLISLALSLLIHAGSFSVFYFGALALSLPARPADFFSVIPIINTLASLPISVGGMGVREKLSQEMFQLCGIAPASAVTISLVAGLVLAFWAVVGGIVYMLYRPSEHARLSEMTSEVSKLGHEIAEEEK